MDLYAFISQHKKVVNDNSPLTTLEQREEDFEPIPGPQQLSSLCSRTNLLYGARVLGAGSLGTGLTGIICNYMMDDAHPDIIHGVLIAIGAALYFGGMSDLRRQPGSQRGTSLRQYFRDAAVPIVTAVSVYFARAHDII